MSSYLIDSIAKGAEIGALGRRSYEARKEREQKEAERQARSELAGVLAEDPTQGGRAIPDTAAPAVNPALPEPGQNMAAGEPAMPEPKAQTQTVTSGVPEEKLKQEGEKFVASKKGKVKTADWADYRERALAAAAKTGNPDAVQAVNKYITDMQHKGFLDNLKIAQTFFSAGDMDKAKTYMERGYQFFPDGSQGEFAVTPDKKSIVLRPIDEATGEPRPVIVFSDKGDGTTTLTDLIANFTDSTAYAYWNYENKYKRGRDEVTDTRNRATDKRADRRLALEEAAAGRARETHGLAIQSAKLQLEDAKRKYGPNSVESQKAQAELEKAQAGAREATMKADEYALPESQTLRTEERKAKVENLKARTAAAEARAERLKNIGNMTAEQLGREARAARKDMLSAREQMDLYDIGEPERAEAEATYLELKRMFDVLYAAFERKAGFGEQPGSSAPPAALDYLRKNPTPENKRFFQQKYGYLPSGM